MVRRSSGRTGRNMFGSPNWGGNAFANALGTARSLKTPAKSLSIFKHDAETYEQFKESGWQTGAVGHANAIIAYERIKKKVPKMPKPRLPKRKKSIYGNQGGQKFPWEY